MIPQVLGQDPQAIQRSILRLREERLRRARRKRAVESIAYYITRIWPWFILEEAHLLLCGYLEALEDGAIDRLMTFMSPRAGKSKVASVVLPSHYMGRYPAREVMQAGHSDDLSRDFGRETKNLALSSVYQEVFPGFGLAADSRAAGRWHTLKGGQYIATGLTGGIAGKGFHLGIIDDPLSEQNARSKAAQDHAFGWYGGGFYTRQAADVSAILMMGTRWDKQDLFGKVLAQSGDDEHADDWTVLRIPAIVDKETAELLNSVADDPIPRSARHPKRYRYKAGDSFAPRRWALPKLLRRKANLSTLDWEALFQQNPTVQEGAILKRSWWQKWEGKPPQCLKVLQFYDTAFSEEDAKNNSYTARTTWGVFEREDAVTTADGVKLPSTCLILLERFNKRVGFPELRREAAESFKLYNPDTVLIEKKASGPSLVQELRRVRTTRGSFPVRYIKAEGDKIMRAHAASSLLEHGFIYYMGRNWAQEVIDQCAEFPTGGFDDLVDTCVYAWLYLRKMFHLRRADENDDDDEKGVDLTPRRLYG